MRRLGRAILLFGIGFPVSGLLTGGTLDGEEFARRRRNVMGAMGGGVLLLRNRSFRAEEEFQGNRDFFYLTGISEEGGVLLLAPEGIRVRDREPGPDYYDGRVYRELLFLPEPAPFQIRWTGPRLGPGKEARELSGVEAVLPVGKLEGILQAALMDASVLYFGSPAAIPRGPALGEDLSYLRGLRDRYFWLEVRNAARLIHPLRMVKGRLELERIQKAVDLAGEAIWEILRQARPGILESEIEGILSRVVRARGAEFSFRPIVGSGKNSTILHYRENRDRLEEGQVVLLDVGVRVEGYASDLTRTFPVSGVFTERQAEIYRLVLEAQRAGIQAVRPGGTLSQIHQASYQVIQEAGYGEFFLHGATHHLGLDVHDVGDLHTPLQPGAVVTVEPGIYLAEEHLGVRIEDDVLVTETGSQVLSDAIPRELEAIQAAMSRK